MPDILTFTHLALTCPIAWSLTRACMPLGCTADWIESVSGIRERRWAGRAGLRSRYLQRARLFAGKLRSSFVMDDYRIELVARAAIPGTGVHDGRGGARPVERRH